MEREVLIDLKLKALFHSCRSQDIRITRGKKYSELKTSAIFPQSGAWAENELPGNLDFLFDEIIKEWGKETLDLILSYKEKIIEDPFRRDLVILCPDVRNPGVHASCISMIHLLQTPYGVWNVKVYWRSCNFETYIRRDLALVMRIVEFILLLVQDEERKIHLHCEWASLHKEIK